MDRDCVAQIMWQTELVGVKLRDPEKIVERERDRETERQIECDRVRERERERENY